MSVPLPLKVSVPVLERVTVPVLLKMVESGMLPVVLYTNEPELVNVPASFISAPLLVNVILKVPLLFNNLPLLIEKSPVPDPFKVITPWLFQVVFRVLLLVLLIVPAVTPDVVVSDTEPLIVPPVQLKALLTVIAASACNVPDDTVRSAIVTGLLKTTVPPLTVVIRVEA